MNALLPTHKAVLSELADLTLPNGEMCVGFAPLIEGLRMERREVRRIVRHLARRGLAEYWRGLSTDAGELAGAGYCITYPGLSLVARSSQ